MARKLIDITGQRFGRVVVTSLIDTARGSRWNCICDCGRGFIATGGHLRDGNTKSCGCYRDEEKPYLQLQLAGQRFGRLVTIEMVPRDIGRGNRRWRCRCDCGNEAIVRGDRLKKGETISCGCAVAGPFVITRPDAVRAEAAQYDRRRLGSITPQEVAELYSKQHGRCANCLADLGTGYHKDHIIPVSRGGLTTIQNIQLLCVPCNRKKYNKMPWEFALEQGRLA